MGRRVSLIGVILHEVIYPLIGLIEDQVKEGQPLGLTCASLQDVNDLFSDDPVPQHLFVSVEKALGNDFTGGSSKTYLQRFPNKLD